MNVSINGPQIYWESSWSVPLLGKLQITASLVDAWIILALIGILCWWLGRGLTVENISKKQAVAELLVTTCQNFVNGNMGEKYAYFAPFIGALFSYSALCSLSSLVGLYPATSDLSTELSWALLVFVSFLDKYCPEQFEILGITKTWFGVASKIYPDQIQVDRHGKKSKVTKLNDGAVLLHTEIPQNETYYIVDKKYYTQVYARVLIKHIKL